MKITATWFPGKFPSFNLGLHTTEDSEEFLSIKGCRIVEGKEGPFVAYPYTKKPDGNYWRHAWGSQAFNEAVLKIALKDRPTPESGSKSKHTSDEDIPF